MSDDRKAVAWWVWLVTGLILAILATVLVLWGQPLYDSLADQEGVRNWVEGSGPWGPLALIALEMAQTLLAPIPGQAIEAVGGYLFGPWLGTLYAMLGVSTGSLTGFLLARKLGRPWLLRLASPKTVARLDDLAQRGGNLFFFLLWLFPFVPDDLVCLAAGLTPMRPLQFLILMVLGRLPGIFVATWIGASATQVKPLGLAAAIVLIAIAALVIWRWGERIQGGMLQLLQRLAGRSSP